MIEAAGAEARLMPIASDTAESLTAVFDLCAGADLIVTIGGASVGDLDLVQQTAMDHGLDLDFYKVAMRPGKPLMAGRLRGTPMIGLPGNPVSAMVCAQLFVIPAIEKMLGLPARLPARSPAVLGIAIGPNGPREHYMRAEVLAGKGGWICTPFERQDSSLLSVLSRATALMVREPGAKTQNSGDLVEFIWL
jgi:molybdopterin molybdotransferase